MADRNLSIRLSVEQAEAVKAALRDVAQGLKETKGEAEKLGQTKGNDALKRDLVDLRERLSELKTGAQETRAALTGQQEALNRVAAATESAAGSAQRALIPQWITAVATAGHAVGAFEALGLTFRKTGEGAKQLGTDVAAVNQNLVKAANAGLFDGGLTQRFAPGVVAAAEAMRDLARATGASTGSLAAAGDVAKGMGISTEAAGKLIGRIGDILENTDNKFADARRTMEAYGVALDGATRNDAPEVLQRLNAGMNQFRDGTAKTSAIVQLYGDGSVSTLKSVANSLDFTNDGVKALRDGYAQLDDRIAQHRAIEAEANKQGPGFFERMGTAIEETLSRSDQFRLAQATYAEEVRHQWELTGAAFGKWDVSGAIDGLGRFKDAALDYAQQIGAGFSNTGIFRLLGVEGFISAPAPVPIATDTRPAGRSPEELKRTQGLVDYLDQLRQETELTKQSTDAVTAKTTADAAAARVAQILAGATRDQVAAAQEWARLIAGEGQSAARMNSLAVYIDAQKRSIELARMSVDQSKLTIAQDQAEAEVRKRLAGEAAKFVDQEVKGARARAVALIETQEARARADAAAREGAATARRAAEESERASERARKADLDGALKAEETARKATDTVQLQIDALTRETDALGQSAKARAVLAETLKAEKSLRDGNVTDVEESGRLLKAVEAAAGRQFDLTEARKRAEAPAVPLPPGLDEPFADLIEGIFP